jgi:hypothetical protein
MHGIHRVPELYVMTTPRSSVIIGVRQSVKVFYLKFQNFLSRVESQACLLEYTFPRAFPSHTSYPASDRTNAVKRNTPLTSKVCLNLLPDYSAVLFLGTAFVLRQENPNTKQAEVSSDVSNYRIFLIDNAHLMYNAQPKLFRHSF